MMRLVGEVAVGGRNDARSTWKVARALLYAGDGMWIVRSVGITTARAANHGTNWSQVPSLAPLAEMRGSADCMVAADSAARPTLNRLGG